MTNHAFIITKRVFIQNIRKPTNLFLSIATTPIILIILMLADQISNQNQEIDYIGFFPGIYLLSLILSLFPIAMAISSELESKSLVLLRLTGVPISSFLVGILIPFFWIGVLSSFLSLFTGSLIGYEISYSYELFATIGLGIFALVGLGGMIGSSTPNPLTCFLVSSLVMFFMIVFSGILFPRPILEIISIFHLSIEAMDLLPSSPLSTLIQILLGDNSIQGLQENPTKMWKAFIAMGIQGLFFSWISLFLLKRSLDKMLWEEGI